MCRMKCFGYILKPRFDTSPSINQCTLNKAKQSSQLNTDLRKNTKIIYASVPMKACPLLFVENRPIQWSVLRHGVGRSRALLNLPQKPQVTNVKSHVGV